MAAIAHASNKRMYSWWWDSHISPKNSKWLQENLTDMDTKVKLMIKLLEEDADSFARRAEMYYKKRPELMKLVEEFYRAYRALAERYDHATGALRQAHKTMAEAFPNQIPLMPSDDSDPRTPETQMPFRMTFDSEEFPKDSLESSASDVRARRRNGAFTEESDSATGRRGLKQFGDIFGNVDGRARRGLSFQDVEEKEEAQTNGSKDPKTQKHLEAERDGESDAEEIISLKKALAKLEAEKEADLLQYQQSMEKFTNMEREFSQTREDSKQLNERAKQAEAEVQSLKESLEKLEAEKEANLLKYQDCLYKITDLENSLSRAERDAAEVNERSNKAELEAETLKDELAKVQAEKEAALAQYKNCLESISNLEDKLRHAENDSREHSERADKAEAEVEKLKEELAKLTEEKEAAARQLLQCLETISDLERKIASAEEEAQRLNLEIQSGVEKLRGAEEKCHLLEQSNVSLHSELESLAQKVGTQNAELLEKQQELGGLWTCIQEERLRFVEAETAFQTLQHLHSQSQEELRSLAAQLQSRNQMLSDLEAHNQGLQAEVHKIAEDNKNLNELNLTSSMTIKSLQEEILSLREMIQKLEQEIELRVNERNALQQEIYCLKEELNDLNKKHHLFLEQVDSVGLDPESFGLSVKELQDEKLTLQELHEQEINEKAVLLEKLAVMDKLVEKNVLLENSLSDLNVELEGVREKVKVLEESCESLLEEKSTLLTEKDSMTSQLHSMTENFDKLTEQNKLLENSLSDTSTEVEQLRIKLEGLEESCLLLGSEKSSLITERESLVSQLATCQEMLKDLEGRHEQLEQRHSSVERERDLFSLEVTKFKDTLDTQRQEHVSFAELSWAQIADKESQLLLLQQEFQGLKRDHKEELDKNLGSQIEMLILLECFRDLEGRSFSLFSNCQKLERALESSGKEISTLTMVNLKQQEGLKSLSDHVNVMQMGLFQLLRIFEDGKSEYVGNVEKDQSTCDYIIEKVRTLQRSLSDTEDKLDLVNIEKLVLCTLLVQAEVDATNLATDTEDKLDLVNIEKLVLCTLLGQAEVDATNLAREINNLELSHRIQQEQILALQNEVQDAISTSEELSLELLERLCKEEVLKITLEFSHVKIWQMQEALRISREENCMVVEKEKYLTSEVTHLREIKEQLEVDATNLAREINNLELSQRIQQEQILALQNEVQDAISTSEELSLELLERLCKEEVLKITLEFSHVKIWQMQEALRISREENCMVVEKEKYLTSEVTHLREIKEQLEVENDLILGESFSKCIMAVVLEDAVSQKISELKESTQEVKELHFLISELEGKIKEMEGNFANEQIERSQLKESLEKLEDELKTATSVNNQLNLDIASSKELLSQTEMKLLEAENMLTAFEMQKKELHDELDSLKGDHAELRRKEEEQRGEFHKLSEELGHQGKQVEILSKEKQQLEAKLSEALKKNGEYEVKEQSLNKELLKLKNETALWETEAATIFGKLLSSNFSELLLEEKSHELDELCKSLSKSMSMETQQLKGKVCALEDENGGLMSKLSAYMSAVVSLTDSVASLEKKAGSRKELHEANNQGIKDDKLLTSYLANCKSPNGHADSAVLDGVSAMEDLQRRIKAMEEQLLGSLDTSRHGRGKHEANESILQKPRVLPTEELTKDIILDQMSECSSYGLSRRETTEADDQMLELWETSDQDGGLEQKVGKSQKAAGVATESCDKEPRKDHRSLNPSAESLIEKELSVDRLESSQSFSDPHQEGNKRKVLERLDSDAQKLTNLQITVEDLKRKVRITEKNKNGKGFEYDSVKEQLEESDVAIRKLYDANQKLVKNIQDGYSSSEIKSTKELEDDGSISRRRISEQARRGSEKIGRLQLELQKIQFLLLKLDDEKEAKGRAKTNERKTRVLLRDYLYGGMKNNQKRKKAHFCSCVQPPTKGD